MANDEIQTLEPSDDEDSSGTSDQPVNGALIPDELLQDVPEELRQAVVSIFSHFQGPLPPPSILKGYEDVEQGLANRIVAMAEDQQKHRMAMDHHRMEIENRAIGIDEAVIRSGFVMERWGLAAGLIIALVMAIGSMVLIYTGSDVGGLAIIIAEIAVLAGVFYVARQRQKEELAEQKTIEDETSVP